jgi:L-alanine-DL-glutamate epimerase-like enolase superfamily enzyme
MLKPRLFHVQQPMSRSFGHAAFQRTFSDSVLLSLEFSERPDCVAIGECAPRRYVTGESADSIIRQLSVIDLAPFYALLDADDPREAFSRYANMLPAVALRNAAQSNMYCLLELALFDLLCRIHQLNCFEGLRHCVKALQLDESRLAQNGADSLSPSVVIDSVSGLQGLFYSAPDIVKVKVNDDLAGNVALVRAVRERFGSHVRLILDANMSWSFDCALNQIDALSPFDVFLYEEPLGPRQYHLLREIRRSTGARLMLDESLITYKDAVTAVEREACDAFNVRVSKCGGLLPSISIIDFAISLMIPYQIGVQVAEVGPLINASRALGFLYDAHFGFEAGQSDRFFDNFVVSPSPTVDRVLNKVARPDGFGFGMTLNQSALPYEISII